MNNYSYKKFINLVKDADIIYGEVSLNAATTVTARVRKKSLLEQLENLNPEKIVLGFYGTFTEDKKGRKILKVL
tara:strand:- start:631 stop:852 length:222 start_codon:yes stop_codon:yes gene_type:complete